MKLIKLTQNQFCLVDNKDYVYLKNYNWQASKHHLKNTVIWYASRFITIGKKRKCILMHRQILNINNSKIKTDHKNSNGLDNRRKNLRIATQSQNSQNRRKRINCTSKFKGVYWRPMYKKWRAQIKLNGKLIFLGDFIDERNAAKAYNNAAIKYFGEFASINKINLDEQDSVV